MNPNIFGRYRSLSSRKVRIIGTISNVRDIVDKKEIFVLIRRKHIIEQREDQGIEHFKYNTATIVQKKTNP